MSELVGKLYNALGGWSAVDSLIEEIMKGNMTFERSGVSTVVAVLDNGIYNPYTGGLTDVRIELYPHDRCGSIFTKGFVHSDKINIREGSTAYQTVLKHYQMYVNGQERSAKSFFCVWDDRTETYLD